ncbi:MAG: bacterioferritin-associated ferredoxin [Acidimicrobiales bacterium]
MIVCHCKRVNDREISRSIDAGASSIDTLARHCGAGSVCGGCRPTLAQLLDERTAGAAA